MPNNDKEKQDSIQFPVLDPRIVYCDSAFITLPDNKESIIFSFSSGGVVVGSFAFAPKHAKRFKLLLEKQIGEYEKVECEMDVELSSE